VRIRSSGVGTMSGKMNKTKTKNKSIRDKFIKDKDGKRKEQSVGVERSKQRVEPRNVNEKSVVRSVSAARGMKHGPTKDRHSEKEVSGEMDKFGKGDETDIIDKRDYDQSKTVQVNTVAGGEYSPDDASTDLECESSDDREINGDNKNVFNEEIQDDSWMNDFGSAKKVRLGVSFDKLISSVTKTTGETDETLKTTTSIEEKLSDVSTPTTNKLECVGKAAIVSNRKDLDGEKKGHFLLLNEEQSGFVRGSVHKIFFRGFKFFPQGGSLMPTYSHVIEYILTQSNIARSCPNPERYIPDIEKKLRWYTGQKRNTVVQQIQAVVKSKK
jgi:hypothetical protein